MEIPSNKYLKRLEIDKYNQVKECLSHIVRYIPEDSSNEKVALIKQENWIAIPMNIEGGFFPKTLECFVEATKFYNCTELFATWIAPFMTNSSPVAFSVPPIIEGVKELNQDTDLLLMNCVVFAGKPDWVYIWFVDYIDIIYAEKSIVRLFTDMESDEAFQAFHSSLNKSPELRATRDYFQRKGIEDNLMAIYNDLKKFNNIAGGTEVIINL